MKSICENICSKLVQTIWEDIVISFYMCFLMSLPVESKYSDCDSVPKV